jgi:ABC-type transport system substrate-binding protein
MLIAVLAAQAETRPQYGGTLHVATHASLSSLDPADSGQSDSFARRSITLLIFDTLVTIDDGGHPHAALATSWQASPTSQQWQFRLRRGVKFHDRSPLTAENAAASIRAANPAWNVTAEGDSVVIDCENADPQLPAELALPRNAIAKRNSDKPSGTGPFQIIDWQPEKKLTLAADEGYWRGRPFLDIIEIEMGRSYRDQMTALELGRTDLAEVAPDQAHRVALEGRGLANSEPVELLAVVFTRDAQTPEEKSLREALAWSVERGSIRSVLLQGAGQPAGGILPNWMSGYEFVFSTDADLARARHAREQFRTIPTWTMGYDSGDPLARLLAERIALNSKDAGLSLQPTSAATADLRLMRIPLACADPWIALASVAATAGLPAPQGKGGSVEDLYAAEQAVLATQRIIPLFHLPASIAAAAGLKNWNLRRDGTLDLADAWLGSGKP